MKTKNQNQIIMSLFKKIGMMIARIHPAINKFLKQFEDEVVQRSLDLAIHMTACMKSVLNSDVVVNAVELTQTDVDNKTRDIMLMVLDTNLKAFTLAKGCGSLEGPNERLNCYLNVIRSMSKDDAYAELAKLASNMAMQMAMGWRVVVTSKNFWNLAIETYLWIKKRV